MFFGTLLESKLTRISYTWFRLDQVPMSFLPTCWHMTSVSGFIREVWSHGNGIRIRGMSF